MEVTKFFTDLLVVIVLFRKKPEQSDAFISIHSAIGDSSFFPSIFIYDNSPEAAAVNSQRITYIHDARNRGISRAYNEALTSASRQNKGWMLFLDQDTTVEKGLFKKFTDAVEASDGSVAFVPRMMDRKGQVSPFYFRAGRGRRTKLRGERFALSSFRFINSGLLIRTSALINAGGYDETIPLDFSDISFGERLRKVTDHFEVVDIELNHSFSGTEKPPLEEALRRYHYFLTGAFGMGRNSGSSRLYLIRALMHASRLALRYKNFRFLKVFLQRAIDG